MAITFDVGQVRRFRDDGRRLVFSNSFQIQALNESFALVFGDCCHEGPERVSNYHKHTLAELCETDLVEPVPGPAQELCAYSSLKGGKPSCAVGLNGNAGTPADHERYRTIWPHCHAFLAPQAKAPNAGALQNVGSIGPAGDLAPAKAPVTKPSMREEIARAHADLQRYDNRQREQGPSAVAAAVAREPWRPSVDDFDLLPDAWR